MRYKLHYSFLIVIILCVSCHKKKPKPLVNTSFSNGILVLCEGLFQQNNATLSWINLTDNSVNTDFFLTTNGRMLGDTGNDLQRYGNKIYVVVNVSSTIEVLDALTGKSIQQISMQINGKSKEPRSLAFHNGQVFVTCFDGYVDVIDTVNFIVQKRIKVGANPEKMDISNGKLYVSNSGGLNAPNVDSTVSVIDLMQLTELKKIVVGKNPGSVQADINGNIYVIARGNYGSIPSRMVKIDAQKDSLVQQFNFDVSGIERMDNQFILSYFDYNTNSSKIALFDCLQDKVINSSFINTTAITTLYGIHYQASTGKVYCLDAMNYVNTGYVHQYTKQGVYEKSFHVGLNPSKILVYE